MWPRDDVLRALRARGELWEPAPGVTALRGDVAALSRALERTIAAICGLETSDEWRVPPAVDFATLQRADYFASFPQWLTVAAHLSDDVDALRNIAEHDDPGTAVRTAAAPADVALNPAVCYHVYSALAGTIVASPKLVTAQSPCWRYEGRHTPLERGWAFTMREIVCVGSAEHALEFLERSIERVVGLARMLDLHATVETATDPFFAPAGRAKQLLQQLKELKRELLLAVEPRRRVAASSFNLHGTFFGDAFDITLATGEPATTACVAFGLERWLLAFLVRHGPDAATWPPLSSTDSLVEVNHG